MIFFFLSRCYSRTDIVNRTTSSIPPVLSSEVGVEMREEVLMLREQIELTAKKLIDLEIECEQYRALALQQSRISKTTPDRHGVSTTQLRAATNAKSGEIVCAKCTFINKDDSSKCVVCGYKLECNEAASPTSCKHWSCR
jgi:hypothetical protein